MKLSFLIFTLPFIFYLSKSENLTKDNHKAIPTCRLEKVFINDTFLLHQYNYDKENRLVQIDVFNKNKLHNIFSLGYDKSNRISQTEHSYVTLYNSHLFEKYDIDSMEYFIHQKTKNLYKYQKRNSSKIKIKKSFSGYSSTGPLTDKDLTNISERKLIYNLNDQIIKIKNITKYKRKKKNSKINNDSWLEFDYDQNNNIKTIYGKRINDSQDTITTSKTERVYDSSIFSQFNFYDFKAFPGVFQYNNIVYEKKTQLGKDVKVLYEYKFTHEYNDKGLVIKTTKETINHHDKRLKGKINVYSFEYSCDHE